MIKSWRRFLKYILYTETMTLLSSSESSAIILSQASCRFHILRNQHAPSINNYYDHLGSYCSQLDTLGALSDLLSVSDHVFEDAAVVFGRLEYSRCRHLPQPQTFGIHKTEASCTGPHDRVQTCIDSIPKDQLPRKKPRLYLLSLICGFEGTPIKFPCQETS
jgi:hypothetical protein